jgi:ribose-phosphate pyrophosphokinase
VSRLHRFPDTEVSFQIDENIRGTDVFIVQPTCSPVDEHLVELCVMIDAFRRSSASRIGRDSVLRTAGRIARTSRACRFRRSWSRTCSARRARTAC